MKRSFMALTALALILGPGSAWAGTPVTIDGDSGQDYSGSAPSIASICAAPLAGPAVALNGFYVQNQSAATLYVVLDDPAGQATPSVMLLAPGAGAGQQGADTNSLPWFKGRIRVCGPAGSQFMFRVG